MTMILVFFVLSLILGMIVLVISSTKDEETNSWLSKMFDRIAIIYTLVIIVYTIFQLRQ